VNSDVEERLRRLEADKDSLQLQVTVLTEQIDVQTDKISDLEKLLDEKKRQLSNAEDMLQRASGTFVSVYSSNKREKSLVAATAKCWCL
jgi:chromosome segregation ATPase